MKGAVITVGDEILIGQIVNTNAAWIGAQLTALGLAVSDMITVGDDATAITEALTHCLSRAQVLIVTGGLGPTHDDITAKSISKAFNVKYEFHKEAYSILEKYYGKKKFNDGRKKMAKMPKSSFLIYNPSSAAPGFKIKNIFCLPGVPNILKSMIENCKKFLIKGSKTHSKTLSLFTVESNISKQMSIIQKKYKKFIDIGSYPFFRLGKIGVSIVCRSTSLIKLKKVNRDLIKMVKSKKIKILKT